jgi:hypothetical protein
MNAKTVPWIISAIAVLIVAVIAIAWNNSRRDAAALAKALEAEKLRSAGFLVQRDASNYALAGVEKKLLLTDADFRAEKARLEKLLGEKPKVIYVEKIVTVPGPATGTPVPCVPPGPNGEPGIACLLAEGNTGHAEFTEVTYSTKGGNSVIIGTGACFRDTPTPTRLFSSALSVDLSQATGKETGASAVKRWGFGVWGSVGAQGWDAGPALAFPPLEAFGRQLEATVGAGLGAGGVWQAGGAVVVR